MPGGDFHSSLPAKTLLSSLALAVPLIGGSAWAAQPCCSVVEVRPDPLEPCCNIVTARNAKTGETFQFRVEGAIKTGLRVGSAVDLDSSGQWASVSGRQHGVIVPAGQAAGAAGSAATAGDGPADARVRELEAKLAAAEARAASGAGEAAGVPCRSVSVLAVWATPAAPLTVKVNGRPVGVYDGSTSTTLDGFLKRGANTVGFSYPAVPRASTEAAIKCLPPEGKSKVTILSLRPAPGRLQADAQVDFVKP